MGGLVEVFVDEYGDRGFGVRASQHVAMTALLVPQESVRHMRAIVLGLQGVIRTTKPLHWVEHFTPKPKHAWRRELAADLLAGIPGAVLIFVVADKETLVSSEEIRTDKDKFYNHVTRLLLEQVDRAAEGWPGGARQAKVRLGSVKNQDHAASLAYLARVRVEGSLGHLVWPVTWHGPGDYEGLQLADLAMGMFSTALRGGAQDERSAAHLLRQAELIRRSPSGNPLGWGITVYGEQSLVTEKSWWPVLREKA